MLRVLTLACFLCAPSFAADVVGWRHDTTGRFPDATPPLRWGPESEKIAWKLAMPGRSGGHPVIVGARIYAMADPHWLCCIDKASGELLWKRAITAEQVTVAGSVERVAEQGARRHALWERREELEKLIEAAKEAGDEGEAQELAAELARSEEERESLPPLESKKPQHGVGMTTPTPISDGERIVCLLHSGLLACFDLDGELLWARMVRTVGKGYGQSMSPALAAGVVGVHIDDAFFGVALADGELLWERREMQHQGSPVGIEGDGFAVFLATDGSVFDAGSGERITKLGFPALNKFNTPVLDGTTARWISEGKFLVRARFAMEDGELRVEKGHSHLPQGTYYASALMIDARNWLVWDNKDYKRKGKNVKGLYLENGKIAYEQVVPVGGWAYPSPALAGGLIYVFGSNGDCVVYWPERPSGPDGGVASLKQVAKNRLGEGIWASPLFEGRRLYLRGFEHLYCIEADDDDLAAAEELADPSPEVEDSTLELDP